LEEENLQKNPKVENDLAKLEQSFNFLKKYKKKLFVYYNSIKLSY
jgi:hypothetical protein